MKKLIDTYDKHLELGETYYLLGVSYPKGIANYTEEKLIQHFLYTYSHLGLSAIEIFSIEKLKERLIHDLQSINNYSKLCNKKKWWCLSLIYLKIGTEYYSLTFFTSAIQTLLDMASSLSYSDLAKYCNIMNDCMSNIIGFELRIRPSKDNNKSTYISKSYLNITSNSNKIIEIFKEFLTLESMMNDEVQKELELLKCIDCEFDSWAVVFDIFVGQLLVSLDSPIIHIGGSNKYENATESALLNLTSRNETIPPHLHIVCKKIATFLE